MDNVAPYRKRWLSVIIFFTFFPSENRAADIPSPDVNSQLTRQVEQDKTRYQQLKPEQAVTVSEQAQQRKGVIQFPAEERCFAIDKVVYQQDSPTLKVTALRYFTRQAEGRCLGIEGIRLLTSVLQNEIIRMGYLTTRITLPDQDLNSRKLHLVVASGNIGKIALQERGSKYISLKNTLPFAEGDLLTLSDLEQGTANLQRIPGSRVKMAVTPGEKSGESDINIDWQQEKYWQARAWLSDSGSTALGRYQGGAALYLHNLTSLSDTLYFSSGRNIAFSSRDSGNSHHSLGYTLPWGYWWLDLYASRSRYQQKMQGNWSDWKLNNENYYYSAQISRLISRTATHKSSVGLQLFNTGSNYSLNESELSILQKKNAGLKASIDYQHNFENAVVGSSLSVQKKLPWFGSSQTVEQRLDLIDSAGRVIMLDVQASVAFNLWDTQFIYSPHVNLQLSPDRLTALDRFAAGGRWNVRGFDGENSVQGDQGGYWRNDLSWRLPGKTWQPYLGLDLGRTFDRHQDFYSSKTLVGSVVGVRGSQWNTRYDLFAGVPLVKPDDLHTDPLTVGFSLQWSY